MSNVNYESAEIWTPRTQLGAMVSDGKITSLDEIFMEGMKIREPEIVDVLLPNLQQKVLDINLVQKQTDAGEKSLFKSVVIVGDLNGHIGLGTGKHKQVRTAIEKGVLDAKLNIAPVKRGCGHWECGCGEPHSLQFKVNGKCGSVRMFLKPAPKGVGIVAGEIAKVVISLSGMRDCWTKSYGSTRTALSFGTATYNALRNTYTVLTPRDWSR